jgi:hypothetical protein
MPISPGKTTLAYSIAPPKLGSTCTKQGANSRDLVCTRDKGVLLWKRVLLKSDKITLEIPKNWYLSQGSIQLSPKALSGKKVRILSESESVCSTFENVLTPLTPGQCVLRLSTIASKKYRADTRLFSLNLRSTNEFEISVKSEYFVDEESPTLSEFSSSGLPIFYTSESKSVCQISVTKIYFVNFGLCTIAGQQNGNAFVDKSSTKSVSFKVVKRNTIFFNPPDSLSLDSKVHQLLAVSSSGLAVTIVSKSPEVCTVSSNMLNLVAHGYCSLEAAQSGNEFIAPAVPTSNRIRIMRNNKITFANPGSVSLKLKSLQLAGFSSSGLPLLYKSLTPSICTTSNNSINLLGLGSCTIVASQAGDELTVAATDVSNTFSISNDRVLTDQPDALNGYQIKAIYVVPKDGTDRQYDTNGYIASLLREGNAFLKSNIGLEYQIDSIGSEYDVQFFRSTYSTQHFLTSEDLDEELALEMKLYENPSLNRKNYVFFIDVPSLKSGTACGYAQRPGLHSIYAIGTGDSSSTCVGKTLNFESYASKGWVHESFHNLGVSHTTDDSCDLMRGSGVCNSVWTLDQERRRYVGADVQGVNILTLRVWKGYTDDQSLRASCTIQYSRIPRGDGLRYVLCPTGTQIIGALTFCWSSIASVELQVWRNDGWVSLGSGNHYSEPWGRYVGWKCSNSDYTAPWKELSVFTPGIQKYRWMINGRESEVFNIIWQR